MQIPFITIDQNEYSKKPEKSTLHSAGYDLYSAYDYALYKKEFLSIGTNIGIEIPQGHVGLICSRSGLALKNGVFVLNAPGIIDADYRGELRVILCNLGEQTYSIKEGDKIAQLLIVPYADPDFIKALFLSHTNRGSNGFGSTGV